MIKEHKATSGVIRYRLPNIIEGMRLLGKLGVNTDGTFSKSEIEMMADLIENVQPYITEISCGTIKDWDSLIESPAHLSDLTTIGTDIINHINQTGETKKRRKKS